jgi:pimeloyl-ACP methyl ester carboxylesterase
MTPAFNTPQFLDTSRGYRLAYHQRAGEGVGVVFLPGFRSDMQGSKALALEAFAATQNIPYTRLDYFAHGESEGEFEQFTLSRAIADVCDVLTHVATGPQILVGSSMGGWIMLQVALRLKLQVAGMIGVAAAPDFTEALMRPNFTDEQRMQLEEHGKFYHSCGYGFDDYPVTVAMLEDAKQHLMLHDTIPLECPLHLIHGVCDDDVPVTFSQKILERVISDEVVLTAVKDGDHRLSRPQDISLLEGAVLRMTHLTNP